MRGRGSLAAILAVLALAGCTSDPNAPVNQTFPIRQMDRFFDSLGSRPVVRQDYTRAPGQDYTRAPGYAPAYPPYE